MENESDAIERSSESGESKLNRSSKSINEHNETKRGYEGGVEISSS